MKKIALVTGAARGLGWGTAEALAKKGYHVGLLGRDIARLQVRQKEIESAGGSASIFPLDLLDSASIDRAISELNGAFPGGVHILVNNAGIFPEKDGAYDRTKCSKPCRRMPSDLSSFRWGSPSSFFLAMPMW